ncbi:g831 [Coccomyxa elongata]
MIPRCIHQLYWDFKGQDRPLPASWQTLRDDVTRLHPEWTVKLWGKSECGEAVRGCCTDEQFALFQQLPEICKSDIARLCVLLVEGGIYLDMDIHLTSGLDVLTTKTGVGCVLFAENCVPERERPLYLGNAAIAAIPRHWFLRSVIDSALMKMPSVAGQDPTADRVLFFCGPHHLTGMAYDIWPGLAVTDLDGLDGAMVLNGDAVVLTPEALLGLGDGHVGFHFGSHACHGSWKRREDRCSDTPAIGHDPEL